MALPFTLLSYKRFCIHSTNGQCFTRKLELVSKPHTTECVGWFGCVGGIVVYIFGIPDRVRQIDLRSHSTSDGIG